MVALTAIQALYIWRMFQNDCKARIEIDRALEIGLLYSQFQD